MTKVRSAANPPAFAHAPAWSSSACVINGVSANFHTQPQPFVLVAAQVVEGAQFPALHRLPQVLRQEGADALQIGFAHRRPRDERGADPQAFAARASTLPPAVSSWPECVRCPSPVQCACSSRIDQLEVVQHHIGFRRQRFQRLPRAQPAGIQRHLQPAVFERARQLQREARLQRRLAA